MKTYNEHVCAVCKQTVFLESGDELSDWVQVTLLGGPSTSACGQHAKQVLAERDGYPEESLQVAAKSLYLAARNESVEVAKKHFEAAGQSLAAAMRTRREAARGEGEKKP